MTVEKTLEYRYQFLRSAHEHLIRPDNTSIKGYHDSYAMGKNIILKFKEILFKHFLKHFRL